MPGTKRGMVLKGSEFGSIANFLRNKQEDIGHHANIGLKRLHQLKGFRCLPRSRLMYRQAFFACKLRQWILGSVFLRRRAANRDDILAPLEQLFQNRFTEGLLAVNHDTHWLLAFPLGDHRRTVSAIEMRDPDPDPLGHYFGERLLGSHLLDNLCGARCLEFGDLFGGVAKNVAQDLGGVFTQ